VPTDDAIREALRRVIDPELRRDVVELRMVREIEVSADGDVAVGIA
jgi:ATP-binding protein involved in chromosome partitioning